MTNLPEEEDAALMQNPQRKGIFRILYAALLSKKNSAEKIMAFLGAN